MLNIKIFANNSIKCYTNGMEKTKKNYNKTKYHWVAIITILVMVALLGATWVLMAFVFPRTFADITYKLNMTSYTRTLYMRDYKKSNDINSLYMATNLSIKLKDYGTIVEYYPQLNEHKDYVGLITTVDEDNFNLKIDNLTKSTLLNEDEYLKNNYVLALVKTSRWQEALEYAKTDFDGVAPTVNSTGNYLFGYIIKYMTLSDAQSFEGDILGAMNAYFDDLHNIIINDFDLNKEVQLIAVCNKMIKVGGNIITLNNALELSELNANINTKLSDAESTLQTLIGD